MKSIKGQMVLLPFFLLLVPLAFAEMQMSLPKKDPYNLGDKVDPEISMKLQQHYSGFFKMYILCTTYSLQYYTVPLEAESGFRAQIDIPPLALFEQMLGECKLRADFDSVNGDRIESIESPSFQVSNEFAIELSNQLVVKPGEDISIIGEARKKNNESIEKADAQLTFLGKQYAANITFGRFEQKIKVENSIEAGNFPLYVQASDKHDNHGQQAFGIEVLPIPTKIENQLSSNKLMPSDKLTAKITLFDHTHKVLANRSINVKLLDPNTKLIGQKDLQSTGYFEFAASDVQEPGTYYIISSFQDVKEQSNFVVEAVKRIKMRQESGIVYIENAGNIAYNEEATIILESDGKKYAITKKIDLKPKEQLFIDLSNEVPKGNYEITLPPIASNDSNNAQKNASAQNVFLNVPVEDNRNALKKIKDGLSIVTGMVVSTAGYVASRPALATTILVIIIIATMIHYSRGFLGKFGKKKETENLFKDFKFDEGNKKL